MSAQPESPLFAPQPVALETEAATIAFAQQLAARLHAGDILLLEGDLGAGKTAFARALIRAYTQDPAQEVPSPTFTLLQTYDGPRGPAWHFDLYRLKDPEEIYELGWEDGLGRALFLIEWPGKLDHLRPRRALTLTLQPVAGKPEARTLTLTDTREKS